FYLLILVGMIVCPSSDWRTLSSGSVLLTLFAIATLGIALPTFLFQMGIELTNPIAVAAVHATVPIFALPVQLFDDRLIVSYHSIAGAIIISFFSLVSLLYMQNNRDHRKNR